MAAKVKDAKQATPQTKAPPPAKRVVVTGASSAIGNLVAMFVAKGFVFGPRTMVALTLVETKGKMPVLTKGTCVELRICNLPLMQSLRTTTNLLEAMEGAEYLFLAEGFPMNPAFSRTDFLSSNSNTYKNIGLILEEAANKVVKILVVSDPHCTNMAIISCFAPSLNPKQLTGLSRVDHNRCVAKLAKILDISPAKVSRVGVWGNSGVCMFPHLRHAKVEVLGRVKGAYEAVGDDHYLKFDFVKEIHQRQNEVFKLIGEVPALTIANAAVQHMKAWVDGTAPNDCTSMVVLSDGSYEVEKGLPFSFPIRVTPEGRWEIVQDLELTFFEKEKLEEMEEHVRDEKSFVLSVLGQTTGQQGGEEMVKTSWDFGSAEPTPCRVLGPLDRSRMAYF